MRRWEIRSATTENQSSAHFRSTNVSVFHSEKEDLVNLVIQHANSTDSSSREHQRTSSNFEDSPFMNAFRGFTSNIFPSSASESPNSTRSGNSRQETPTYTRPTEPREYPRQPPRNNEPNSTRWDERDTDKNERKWTNEFFLHQRKQHLRSFQSGAKFQVSESPNDAWKRLRTDPTDVQAWANTNSQHARYGTFSHSHSTSGYWNRGGIGQRLQSTRRARTLGHRRGRTRGKLCRWSWTTRLRNGHRIAQRKSKLRDFERLWWMW